MSLSHIFYSVVLYKDENDIKRAKGIHFVENFDTRTWGFEPQLGYLYCKYSDINTPISGNENDSAPLKRIYDEDSYRMYVSLLSPNADIREWNFVDDTKTTKALIKKSDLKVTNITTTDWRTELYLQGVIAEVLATNSNYYYTELSNEWPKIYDIENGTFYEDVLKDPTNLDFFLDFIDADSAIGEFCIDNIGRRTMAEVDDKVNCVFSIDPYDCIILNTGDPDMEKYKQEAQARDQHWTSVDSNVYKNLVQGGSMNSAYEKVRDLLYQYTSYCESITLQTIPIYHLDVNTRITVNDPKSNIAGDYMINRITLPLDCSGTMSISATRALDRI